MAVVLVNAVPERIPAPRWDACNVCRQRFRSWPELREHKARVHGVLPLPPASMTASTLDPRRFG